MQNNKIFPKLLKMIRIELLVVFARFSGIHLHLDPNIVSYAACSLRLMRTGDNASTLHFGDSVS